MEQTKAALTAIEQAVLKLETAVYETKKNQAQLSEEVLELKDIIKKTYDRLNAVIDAYQKEGE